VQTDNIQARKKNVRKKPVRWEKSGRVFEKNGGEDSDRKRREKEAHPRDIDDWEVDGVSRAQPGPQM